MIQSFAQMSTFRNTILTIKLIFSLLVVTLTSVKELKSQTPTQITNWTELDAVRNNLSGSYILMNDIDANSSGYSTLASATANSNQGWEPLGNSSTPFTGTFNGNGKKIEGMVIQRSNVQRMGLFGQTDGATIQNLGLINPTVEITGSGSGLGSNVGSLVGLADDGTSISNCYADGGSVKAEGAGIGGLIGQLSNSSLINSFAIVAVDGPQDQYSAGLVGVNTSSSITNCYAAGSVVLNQVSTTDYSKGLTQNNGGTITNSFYDATTTGQSTGGGTGLTTSQMQQQATFTNWDFQCETTNGTDNIWGIDEGESYPVLSVFGYIQECLGSWVGSVSSDWNTAGNWANNLVPIPNIPINIDANAQNDLVLDQNRDVGNVTFNAADKKIVLGDYNLKINGQINDVNAANYIQTNGSGSLINSIANATSFVFPVGNVTYNPVTLTNKSGAADVFSAKVRDEVLLNGTAGSAVSEPHVGVTWDIDKGNPNDEDGIDLVFQWNASQEVGTLTDYTLNHHNGSAWEIALGNSGAVSGTPKTMTHTGYTGSFSPFAISGSDVTPLPVEWYEFSAKAIENQVVLNWSTISETNSQYFEVQHAQDAQNWTTIDMVQASVNTNEKSNYHFLHKNPNQINFYRIKQVDWDGNYSLSAMQTVVFKDRQSANMPKIYPNPSMGSVTIDWEGHAACDILDMHGRTVFQKAFENTLHIDSLKQGVYLLYIKTNQDTFKSKLIITNQ